MSALWNERGDDAAGASSCGLVPMSVADLHAVLAVEVEVYPFPWTRGNFIDSLAAGYEAWLLRADDDGSVIGYCVAMLGAGEMHLLNITVAVAAQGRGHSRRMLAHLLRRCSAFGAERLWLEVRVSNVTARSVYDRLGFVTQGVRPGYYPAAAGQRESAVVMSLGTGASTGSGDALD